ncbi:cobalamin-binding protein [Halomonas sp. HP20-15]|uniref:cobalamin-binding protein n=1 Tax=Halomonas sp. HP20-15 TaxID=3085901 RepID=UPI002980F3C5|nr:cobalamin-binding protein [Halomonas sp. HP20-15]MDW5376870.1 cobalamin-binding protein [Halomonas sp. HP20-15]
MAKSLIRAVAGAAALTLGLGLAVEAPAAVTVIDDNGDQVTLDAPARRIVALAPHAVEMLYAVGAGDALVGAIDGSDYPAAARLLPRVGSYRGILLEAVLARGPDLVVTWASGTPQALVERLHAIGIPVYASEPRALPDIAENLRELGRLAGHGERGEYQSAVYLARLAALEQTFDEPPRVFYQLGASPLTTLAGGHIVTQVIRGCGGAPLFAEQPVLVPQVGREALISARPTVILSAAHDDAWQAAWQRWPLVPAVASGQLYTLEPDWISRPGPRLLDAMDQVCSALRRSARQGQK